MDAVIPFGHYRDLIEQIEIDLKNLKESFEKFKNNTTDKKLLSELWQNYAYLFQDIKYVEKIEMRASGLEKSISVRFLGNLEGIKVLLREVKEFLLYMIICHIISVGFIKELFKMKLVM